MFRWFACHVFHLHAWVGDVGGPVRCRHCPARGTYVRRNA